MPGDKIKDAMTLRGRQHDSKRQADIDANVEGLIEAVRCQDFEVAGEHHRELHQLGVDCRFNGELWIRLPHHAGGQE